MANSYSTIDEYIAQSPDSTRAILGQLRAVAHEVAPELTETISYGVPAFRLGGKNAFFVGAYPKHISVYPVPHLPSLQERIRPYVKGKGTLQFQLSQPIPYELIREVMEAHVLAARERSV